MSASMTMPEQIDGLEKLLALVNLKPENIIATQKAAREQLQLTQEEQGKLAEAKAYIATYNSLNAELKSREDALANEKREHAIEVEKHATHVASENTRLETFAAQLEAKRKQQEDTDAKQLAEAARLQQLNIDMNREHQEAMAEIQKQQLQNNADKKANEEENDRLKDWESNLKKKAQSLRDQAANF